MKYIRTEKGFVCEVNDNIHIIKNNKLYEKEYFNNPFGDGSDECLGEVFIGDILKQADTPEELCDCYVITKFREVFVIDAFSKQICVNHIKSGNGDVYGAIWTDKGLIYVAKMNDEGVLELI